MIYQVNRVFCAVGEKGLAFEEEVGLAIGPVSFVEGSSGTVVAGRVDFQSNLQETGRGDGQLDQTLSAPQGRMIDRVAGPNLSLIN